MKPQTIAIDGPAASGKSTIGYHLARYLGYLYLDTGALYRAVTWAVLQRGVPIEDEGAVTALAEALHIDAVSPRPQEQDGRQYTILVEGEDVTWALRSAAVDAAVSPVSTYPGVRAALTAQMRAIARRGQVVMVGRDIGTVVLPDADLKLYVVASAEVRAARRFQELVARGQSASYEAILQNIRTRDAIDSSRQSAPLRPAPDAIILDTTDLPLEQMLRRVEQLVEAPHPA